MYLLIELYANTLLDIRFNICCLILCSLSEMKK